MHGKNCIKFSQAVNVRSDLTVTLYYYYRIKIYYYYNYFYCSHMVALQVSISAKAEQQDPLLLLLQQQPTSKVYLNSTFLQSRATHLQGATFLAHFSSLTDAEIQMYNLKF